MSGFAGIWNLDGRPVDADLIAKMSAEIAHRGEEGVHVSGAFGIACRVRRVTPEAARETQPLVLASGAVLGFDGRLDNREELLAELKDVADVGRDDPDPVLVAAVYEQHGERFPERLNGDFAIAVFDPARGLLLARDALGVRPVYHHRVGDTFLFASEIKPILSHPGVRTEPNDDMILSWLSREFEGADGETFFAGIRSVVPGYVVAARADGIRVRRYWDFDTRQTIRFGSPDQYIEAFRERFETAVRRRLRSATPVTLWVSGGLDSSYIYCVAEKLGRDDPSLAPVVGLSRTYERGSPSDEERYLEVLEQALGTTITRVPSGDTRILDGALEHTREVELPLFDNQWRDSMESFRVGRDLGSQLVLTGSWGDQVLTDQAYLVDMLARLRLGTVVRHLRTRARWGADVPASWHWRRLANEVALWRAPPTWVPTLRRVRDRFSGSPRLGLSARRSHGSAAVGSGDRGATYARSLYREVRAVQHVLWMEVVDKVAAHRGIDMAFPFLDRNLIEYLMAIPGEVHSWEGVPRGLEREAMLGVVPDAIRSRLDKADVTHLRSRGLQESREFLSEVLRSGEVARRGFVRAIGDLDPEDAAEGELARDLVGLELWLRALFGPSRV